MECLIMDKNKEDYIYNLCYKNQIIHYWDDTMFQNEEENSDVKLNIQVPKMSAMAMYFEEYAQNFLSSSNYLHDGIVSIPCGIKEYLYNEKPKIRNQNGSTVVLRESQMGESMDIYGEKLFSVKYFLDIDIKAPMDEIINDLYEVKEDNRFLNYNDIMGFNIDPEKSEQIRTYFSGLRFHVLSSQTLQFAMIEYYYLRRYAKATINQARKQIEFIYT